MTEYETPPINLVDRLSDVDTKQNFTKINSIKAYDFSTLYLTIPHNKLIKVQAL